MKEIIDKVDKTSSNAGKLKEKEEYEIVNVKCELCDSSYISRSELKKHIEVSQVHLCASFVFLNK